jgi:hypothetical protein
MSSIPTLNKNFIEGFNLFVSAYIAEIFEFYGIMLFHPEITLIIGMFVVGKTLVGLFR